MKWEWTRWRKWKRWLVAPVVLAAGILFSGDYDEDRWFAAVLLTGVLVVGYVAEEIFWIARNRGRPCPDCGRPVRLRPFRVTTHCPHCGTVME